jgi:uncharacterized metal-binding protein YceD (DUF177 family)
MEKTNQYVINLRDQKTDQATYQWELDDNFFSAVEATTVHKGKVNAMLTVRRTAGAFELMFKLTGVLILPCDHCYEDMEQPIETEETLKAKLGDEYDDDGELVTVPYTEGVLDVSWLMYEFIALQIPMRHVHAWCEEDSADVPEGEE